MQAPIHFDNFSLSYLEALGDQPNLFRPQIAILQCRDRALGAP
jgi:hypothetical protein